MIDISIKPFGHEIQINYEDASEILYEIYHNESKNVVNRCLVIYKLLIEPTSKDNMPKLKEVATELGMSRNTVARVLDGYLKNGIDAVLYDGHMGRTSCLDAFRDDIADLFLEMPPLTVKEATRTINENLNLDLSQKAVRRWLKKNGYRPLKPRSIPAKADPEEQYRFLYGKLWPLIKAALKGELLLFFADGAHLIYGFSGNKCWAQQRPQVKSAYGRKRLNCLGFLNAGDLSVTTIMNDTSLNSQSVIEGMIKLRFENPDQQIAIILDNARYQNNNWVKHIADYVGVSLIFLPAYSPNLNLIERLWKFLRHEIISNKYYDNFEEFYLNIDEFLSEVHVKYEEELHKLLAFNFEILDGTKATSGVVKPKFTV